MSGRMQYIIKMFCMTTCKTMRQARIIGTEVMNKVWRRFLEGTAVAEENIWFMTHWYIHEIGGGHSKLSSDCEYHPLFRQRGYQWEKEETEEKEEGVLASKNIEGTFLKIIKIIIFQPMVGKIAELGNGLLLRDQLTKKREITVKD